MKFKYNPTSVYVLADDRGYVRIICEAAKLSLTSFNTSKFEKSSFGHDLDTIKMLTNSFSYKIVQEWK